MKTLSNEELTARLEKLERENSRLKRIGGVALASAAALLGLAFAPKEKEKSNKPLETSKIILQDQRGNSRGWLAAGNDGIGLTFGDGKSMRSAIVLNGDGVAIKYFNEGTPFCGIGVQKLGVSTAVKGAPQGQGPNTGLNALVNGIGNSLDPVPAFDQSNP